jgi:hypothetical protein
MPGSEDPTSRVGLSFAAAPYGTSSASLDQSPRRGFLRIDQLISYVLLESTTTDDFRNHERLNAGGRSSFCITPQFERQGEESKFLAVTAQSQRTTYLDFLIPPRFSTI